MFNHLYVPSQYTSYICLYIDDLSRFVTSAEAADFDICLNIGTCGVIAGYGLCGIPRAVHDGNFNRF